MKVALVGVSHGYQLLIPDYSTVEGAKQMQRAMVDLCKERGFVAVAEEMSDHALTERKAEETSGRFAAKQLNLPHRMCDMDGEERVRHGVKDVNQVAFDAWFNHWAPEKKDAALRAENYDPRERVWLQRLLEFNQWPCLFICGSDHVDSFADKMRAEGIEVEIAERDWLPTPGARVAD